MAEVQYTYSFCSCLEAFVTALLKTGDQSDMTYYRQVSPTSVFCFSSKSPLSYQRMANQTCSAAVFSHGMSCRPSLTNCSGQCQLQVLHKCLNITLCMHLINVCLYLQLLLLFNLIWFDLMGSCHVLVIAIVTPSWLGLTRKRDFNLSVTS